METVSKNEAYLAAGFLLGLTLRENLNLNDLDKKMLKTASFVLKHLLDEDKNELFTIPSR